VRLGICIIYNDRASPFGRALNGVQYRFRARLKCTIDMYYSRVAPESIVLKQHHHEKLKGYQA
jgi:hypothetical protein